MPKLNCDLSLIASRSFVSNVYDFTDIRAIFQPYRSHTQKAVVSF